MEIDKILFGILTSKGVNGDFETYDVNSDGIINEEDASLAQSSGLANQIRALLSSVDEEAVLDDDASLDLLETSDAQLLQRAGAATGDEEPAGVADTQKANTNLTKAGAQKTQADKNKAAQDILAKYPIGEATGAFDDYSMNNPALVALKKAVDAGILTQLANEGFTQEDIIDIINIAYPTVHITNNSTGGYTCPLGHGADAQSFYADFINKMKSLPSAKVQALKNELAAMNATIKQNNAQLDKLNGTIDSIEKEVDEIIETAIRESNQIQEAQKEEAANIVREELSRYSVARGDISYDEFKNNVATRLDDVTADGMVKISGVITNMLDAEKKMDSLNEYINDFKSLAATNKTLGAQAVAKEQEIADELKKTPPCDPPRTDPIGFTVNGVRYDFFVDKDNNGGITNETEFLGAQNGWSEMVALDTDHDGKVSVAEMANVKIVVTAADGTQSIKSAAEVFASDDNVNLNSYKTMNENFANGNTLLGTYSLTMNGQQVDDGYNTMDKLTWLDDNYSFTDEDEGKNRFSQGNTKAVEAKDYSSQASVFELDYNNKTVKLGQAWAKVGVTRDNIMTGIISERAKSEAQAKARVLEDIFKRNNNNNSNSN